MMEKISRKGFLKIAAATAMSGVTAAGLAACNAAHVIADVGITDGAAVDAAPDHTGRGTRHAADVGNIVGLFGVQQVLQLVGLCA